MKTFRYLMTCFVMVAGLSGFAVAQESAGPLDLAKGRKAAPSYAAGAAPGQTLGYTCEFGAFELPPNNADGDGMFLLRGTQFPSTGNKFYHQPISYWGQYTATIHTSGGDYNYEGDLYQTQTQVNGEDRYFFFGKDDMQGPGRRWLIFYRGNGTGTVFVANVGRK